MVRYNVEAYKCYGSLQSARLFVLYARRLRGWERRFYLGEGGCGRKQWNNKENMAGEGLPKFIKYHF